MDTKAVYMNSKKSLGHFPFGYSSQGESDYSFIPDLNGGETTDVDMGKIRSDERNIFRSKPAADIRPRNMDTDDTEYVQVGSVKVKKSSHTTLFEEEDVGKVSILEREVLTSSAKSLPEKFEKDNRNVKSSHKKKVVSYYLEEVLIDQVKTYADSIQESYSAVAASAIKEYLEKRMDDSGA